MLKSLSLVAAAGLIAGAATLLPGLAPKVAADTPQPLAKVDRLSGPVKSYGPACSQRAWPYYEAGCLRGGGYPRAVRIVSTDRLTGDLPAAIRRAR